MLNNAGRKRIISFWWGAMMYLPSHEAAWDVAQSCLTHIPFMLVLPQRPKDEYDGIYHLQLESVSRSSPGLSPWLEAEVKLRLKD